MPRAQRRRGRCKPCETCLDLDYELMRSPGAGHFHPQGAWSDHLTKVVRINVYLLDESKKKGCQICFAVLKAVDLLTREWLPRENPPADEEGGPTDAPAASPAAAPGPASTSTPASASEPAPFAFLSMVNALALEGSWVQLVVRKASFHGPEIAHPLEVICNLVVSGRVNRPSGGAFIKVHPTHFGANGGQTIRFGFELYSHPDRPAPWPAFHPARHVPVKLPSERRKSLLAEWIKGCNDNHHACRFTTLSSLPEPGRYRTPKRLAGEIDIAAFTEVKGRYSPESRQISSEPLRKPPPKRLLDLSGNPRNYIKLVDADGIEGTYATLSHSRGVSYASALHLSADTVNKMKRRISWAELVPAYQDAVVVAAEQGIRYLWIDWLCIMVDDPAETNWHIENMHEIYGQSYLNIALSQARDFRRGSLGKRWLNPSRDAEVKTWQIDLFKDGKTWPVYVRSKFYNSHGTFQFSKSSLHTTSRVAEDYIRRFPPMFKTAWVFQERILAPRTVHFNTSEMLWECRSCIQCECSLNVCDTLSLGTLGTLGSSKFSLSQLGVALIPIQLDKDTQLRQLWRHMWPVYSHLRTTHPNRRLQALIGLATMFQKLLGQSFVAGLFANTPEELARELLWGVERNNTSASVPSVSDFSADTYKFSGLKVPSWTWISMIARWPDAVGHPEIVRRGRFCVSPNFDVVQVSTTPPFPRKEDHAFNADSWTLHLRGKMLLGKIATWDRRNRHYQFVPSNVVQFPPSLPPPTIPITTGRRPYIPGIVGVGGIEVIDVTSRRPQASIVLPPILPAPPPATPSPSTTATSSRSSSPATLDTPPLPRVVSRPLLSQELISSMGMFTPDCDSWDERRKETANFTMDGIVTANHTYAYFLLLGTIDMVVTNDFTDHTDIGLVLRRAEDFQGSGTKVKRGTFHRVGYFTAPRVTGLRGLGDFFKDAQVQNVEIV